MTRRFTVVEELEARLTPAANLVADLNTYTVGSVPAKLTEVNGTIYFQANDGVNGVELWRSDGTDAGTFLVKNIAAGSASSSPKNLFNWNGTLYFAAAGGGPFDNQLWKSDGTSAGTVLVANITTGTFFKYPTEFTPFNGFLYFSAGGDFWRTNGTTTNRVYDAGSDIGEIEATSTTLFLSSYAAGSGQELWKSDGTSAGTVLLADLSAGVYSSNPAKLTAVGNQLFFTASAGFGEELYVSNGTVSGTTMVADLYTGNSSAPKYLTNLNGTLAFSATTGSGSSSKKVMRSDGTTAGTFSLLDGTDNKELYNVNGTLWFATWNNFNNQIWTSDGTVGGTVLVKTLQTSAFANDDYGFTSLNGLVYFAPALLGGGQFDRQLWQTDGTAAGTTFVKSGFDDFANATGIEMRLASSANRLVFTANFAPFGIELWSSDGTAAGTTVIRDLNTSATISSSPTNYAELNGAVIYSANNGPSGAELWRTDGTSAGTTLLKDIYPGTFGSTPTYLTNLNGQVIFAAFSPATGNELWRTDGTSAGTMLLKDISPAGSSGPKNFRVVGNLLYFQANDGTNGGELWRTDGTSTGTVLVSNIYSGAVGSLPANLVNVNGTLYFTANTSAAGIELWKSNGTSTGTTMVRDLTSGSGSSTTLANLTPFNNKLFFTFNQSGTGNELWSSDGTSTGTTLFRDLAPNALNGNPANLLATGSALYFTATDGFAGTELWKSDGTTAGTAMVKDIIVGSTSGTPANLVLAGGNVYFTANDGVAGTELWKTDGTSTGTVIVRDIFPGTTGSSASLLSNAGGMLLFTATNGTSGIEVWSSNGTSTGTVLVQDLTPGSAGTSVLNFFQAGGDGFFSANVLPYGTELWRTDIRPFVTAITSPNPNGTYTTGQSLNIVLNFNEPVTLSGGNLTVSLNSGATLTVTPFAAQSSLTIPYTITLADATADLTVTSLALTSGATLLDAGNNDASLSLPAANLGVNKDIIVNPPPPTTVSAIGVNTGAAQRSRVTSLTVTFTNPVNAADYSGPGAITLTRTTGTAVAVQTGATGPNGRILVSPISGTVTSLILTFDNANASPISAGVEYGSLVDGRWQLSIPSLGYTSNANSVRRLFGDHDGNGTVDATDLGFFPAFGSAVNHEMDFNGNGDIDSATDFAQFGNRFGVTL